MGNILKLSTQLSNMIAAGEVVEKPMNVVKELVENSIDADATLINVYLIDSGIKQIKVVDNGCGMVKEDVKMAFQRHATSKIKTEYDLFRINSLGFRGEAVPSIASVSQMQISSSVGDIGYQVTYKAGILLNEGETPINKGTSVIVNDLFYNTPARLKYLKALPKELASIINIMNKFSISNPNKSFSLYNNDKLILKTTGNNDFHSLFGEIYGFEVSKNLVFCEYSGNGYNLKFIYAKPYLFRSHRNDITLICNNRYVKSNVINNAVMDAFYTYVPNAKFPIITIFLQIDPLLIDVNVHPTKTEIKISNEEILVEVITKELKKSLANEENIKEEKLVEEIINKSYNKTSIFEINNEFPSNEVVEKTNVGLAEDTSSFIHKTADFEVLEENLTEEKYSAKIEENKIIEEKKELKLPYMEYVGSVFGLYLIYQNNEGMYLIDQHAANERIRYEYYYELLSKPSNIKTELLIPYILEFTKDEMIYIELHLEDFKEMGFTLEMQSLNSYYVREVPIWVDFDDVEDFIRFSIMLMLKNKKINIMYFRDEIAKQISCKTSIKANDSINLNEINSLFENLNKCKNPYTCPHGRPTLIKITTLELEKMFKRVI